MSFKMSSYGEIYFWFWNVSAGIAKNYNTLFERKILFLMQLQRYKISKL